MAELRLNYVSTEPQTVRLSEGGAHAGNRPTIQQTVLREGTWKHPGAPGGKLDVSKMMLDGLKAKFDAGVGLGGDKVPFHFGHTEAEDETSQGWGKLEVVPDEARPGKHKMVAAIDFTSDAAAEAVLSQKWAFTSPTILFGYEDKETGTKHDAVIRNVAFTNYPYIQKMGRAAVVNLSEVQAAVRLGASAGGDMDFGTGGPQGGEPNPDGLPDGYDLTKLPKECLTCARLGNDCPFAADAVDDDLALKTAAAQAGNCPQYVEADSLTPGGGGPADAAQHSPAAGRTAGTTRLSEGGDEGADSVTPLHYSQMLFDASQMGTGGTPQSKFAQQHGAALGKGLKEKHIAQFEKKDAAGKRGDNPIIHVRITRQGQAALAKKPSPKQEPTQTARLSETAQPAPKGTMTMTPAQIKRLQEQAAQIEKTAQEGFITRLSDELKLPAATLTDVKKAFEDGSALSVQLSDALEGADGEIVRLTEDAAATPARPEAMAKLPQDMALSDCVTLPRTTLRVLLENVAKVERTGAIQLADTTLVDGRPDAEKKVTLTEQVAAEADPDKALAMVRDAAKKGEA